MKARDPMAAGDGFDKNVAERMPRIKREEEPAAPPSRAELQPPGDLPLDMTPPEREPEETLTPPHPEERPEKGQGFDVQRLIEDLHAQLLASSQTRRALELDLASSRRTIHQYILDNKDLRQQVENLRKEFQKLRAIQTETAYLKEENTDALERIQEYQQEVRALNEAFIRATQEKEDALHRARELQSQADQSEVAKIKGRLKEREVSQLAEENRELRSRLEEALSQGMELERKYHEIKRSFDEVRESLTFLRDSCKTDYYHLSNTPNES
jgi:chromosome segregation ATPase